MTRDSIIWWLGIITAVVVGVATVGDAELVKTYGIPEAAVPYIRLSSLVLGIVSGKMATSPLKGKDSL